MQESPIKSEGLITPVFVFNTVGTHLFGTRFTLRSSVCPCGLLGTCGVVMWCGLEPGCGLCAPWPPWAARDPVYVGE